LYLEIKKGGNEKMSDKKNSNVVVGKIEIVEVEKDMIKIEKDNEIQLPQKAMDYIGIKPGDRISISVEGLNNDVIVLQKA